MHFSDKDSSFLILQCLFFLHSSNFFIVGDRQLTQLLPLALLDLTDLSSRFLNTVEIPFSDAFDLILFLIEFVGFLFLFLQILLHRTLTLRWVET